jgi:hypothetical protein
MGAWIIGGNFGGLAFRESKDYKFKDGSPFLPHIVRGDLPNGNQVEMSAFAKQKYGELYQIDTTLSEIKASTVSPNKEAYKQLEAYKNCTSCFKNPNGGCTSGN